MAKKETTSHFGGLIETTTDAFTQSAGDDASKTTETHRMVTNRQSVYRVPLSMVLPDRFQARFTLPGKIRERFFNGTITWHQAAAEWLAMARRDRLIQREMTELLFLGDSLKGDGQIKPVTGQVIQQEGREVFLLLTGERRFWATALKAVQSGATDEPYLLAIIDNDPTLEKQIAENMAYKPLNAVAKARAAARVVLEANQISPQPGQNEYTYFRQVSDIRLTEELKASLQEMLQLERTYFGRLMKFFDLPEDLVELADRADMPERVLREIMAFDASKWQDGVKFYADREGSTYVDVHDYLTHLSDQKVTREARPPADPATKSARAMRRILITTLEEIPADDKIGTLADALVGDVDVDTARRVLERVNQLQTALDIRVKNMH